MTSATLIALVIGTVIPGLTALVTKESASPGLKAILTALLAAVSGAVTTLSTTPPAGSTQWKQFVGAALVSWVTAAAAYFFAWKPSGAAKRIENATSRFGIGPSSPPNLSE